MVKGCRNKHFCVRGMINEAVPGNCKKNEFSIDSTLLDCRCLDSDRDKLRGNDNFCVGRNHRLQMSI